MSSCLYSDKPNRAFLRRLLQKSFPFTHSEALDTVSRSDRRFMRESLAPRAIWLSTFLPTPPFCYDPLRPLTSSRGTSICIRLSLSLPPLRSRFSPRPPDRPAPGEAPLFFPTVAKDVRCFCLFQSFQPSRRICCPMWPWTLKPFCR